METRNSVEDVQISVLIYTGAEPGGTPAVHRRNLSVRPQQLGTTTLQTVKTRLLATMDTALCLHLNHEGKDTAITDSSTLGSMNYADGAWMLFTGTPDARVPDPGTPEVCPPHQFATASVVCANTIWGRSQRSIFWPPGARVGRLGWDD